MKKPIISRLSLTLFFALCLLILFYAYYIQQEKIGEQAALKQRIDSLNNEIRKIQVVNSRLYDKIEQSQQREQDLLARLDSNQAQYEKNIARLVQQQQKFKSYAPNKKDSILRAFIRQHQ